MKVDDVDQETAPETGYEDALHFSMSETAQPRAWSRELHQAVWVRFQDGTYGRVTINMYTFGDHFVHIEGQRNPVASDRRMN